MLTPEQNRDMAKLSMYSKLQDKLMIFGDNAILNMVVILYPSSEKYGRKYYYKEIQYANADAGVLTKKMIREFDSFLALENLKPVNNYKEYFTIRGKELEMMRMFLIPKFEELIKNFGAIFEVRSNKIYVNEFKPIECEIGTGKVIIFKPGLKSNRNGDTEPSIEVYLNSPNNMTNLSFSQLYEFMYVIRTIQIHTYASTMVNYLGRPATGTNLIDMAPSQSGGVDAIIMDTLKERQLGKRVIPGSKSTSYFNKRQNTE